MVRTIITPDKNSISISDSQNFVGKKVEVIAFTIEETVLDMDKPVTHFASENVLVKDWLATEEDGAWRDL